MDLGAVFFNIKLLAEYLLRCDVGVGKIGTIGPDVDLRAEKNWTKCHESFDDRQKFFLDRSVVALGAGELSRKESDRAAMLLDDGTELIIGGISLDVKWFIRVGISKEDILSNHGFNSIESEELGFMPTFTENFIRL
jgi:hypothetical protein